MHSQQCDLYSEHVLSSLCLSLQIYDDIDAAFFRFKHIFPSYDWFILIPDSKAQIKVASELTSYAKYLLFIIKFEIVTQNSKKK